MATKQKQSDKHEEPITGEINCENINNFIHDQHSVSVKSNSNTNTRSLNKDKNIDLSTLPLKKKQEQNKIKIIRIIDILENFKKH